HRPPFCSVTVTSAERPLLAGGAEGNRTPDLCSAIAALSHLSYSPAPPARKPVLMGSDRLGSGSLAACLPPCNRPSHGSFGPPIWGRFSRVATGTAANAQTFVFQYPAGSCRPLSCWRT